MPSIILGATAIFAALGRPVELLFSTGGILSAPSLTTNIPKMKTCKLPIVLAGVLLALSVGSEAQSTSVNWSDLGLQNDSSITGSSLVASDGVIVSLSYALSASAQGDTGFEPRSVYSDFVVYRDNTLGATSPFIGLGFEQAVAPNPDNRILFTISFSEAVTGLSFSLLDVDSIFTAGLGRNDAVQVTYNNGINALTDGVAYSFPGGASSTAKVDDKSYFDGWEAAGPNLNAPDGGNLGNVDLDFGNRSISSVTVEFFANDYAATPYGQIIGVSGLTYSTVPEPSGALLVGVAGFFALLRHKRKA